MYTTEAWVLKPGQEDNTPATLQREAFSFQLREDDILIKPLFGSWEANMEHALQRSPIDICHFRKESPVVIGNAGVAEVLEPQNSGLKKGQICLVLASTEQVNRYGFPQPAYAYDAPNTVGLLAKTSKVHQSQLLPIPENTRFKLEQWAAFSLRYLTAWGNWKVAYPSFRALLNQEECPRPHVWGWGGGVALAELELARFENCIPTLISSRDTRLKQLELLGITGCDRRAFSDLDFNLQRYKADAEYRQNYLQAERLFLKKVKEHTQGEGVGIFIDLIGGPVYRATLKALGWPGVITTAGWKHGMELKTNRALECMHWHSHIHSHYVRRQDAIQAMAFAEREGWMPHYLSKTYNWENIPQLAEDYRQGMDSYFPIYQINAL